MKLTTAIAMFALALLVAGCGGEEAPEGGGGDGGMENGAPGNGAMENGGMENGGEIAATPLPEATYEVGCFGCIFEDPDASGCQTAVKVGDEVFAVMGEGVPDAHTTGLCSASKQAVIAGEVKDGTVHVTKFTVVE